MDSASVADKSNPSKSEPNREDGSLATASAVPILSRDSPEVLKRRYWNIFLRYLGNQKPPITLAECSENHVLDFLRNLDQFGQTKVHLTGCPFFGHPNPPAPCACPLRLAWSSFDLLIGRLRSAYVEHGGRPESNPFAAGAVWDYLNEVRESQAKARGNTTGTGSDGDGSGSAAQTTSTPTTRRKKALMKFLEKQRQRKSQSYPMMSAAGLTRKGIVLGKMGNLSKDNKPVIGTFQKALPKHHNPDTLKKLNDAEKAKRELEPQVYFNTELANEEHEKEIQDPPTDLFWDYFSEYNEPDIEIFQEAGGEKMEVKRPTTAIDSLTTSTIAAAAAVACCDGDGSGSAAQTISPTTSEIVKASERRRQHLHQSQSDPTMLAPGLTRKGMALGKMENLSKDNEPVTDTFQKALPVHHNPDTLKKLNDAEKAKRELQQQEYFDIKLANKEHEKDISILSIFPKGEVDDEEDEEDEEVIKPYDTSILSIFPKGEVDDEEDEEDEEAIKPYDVSSFFPKNEEDEEVTKPNDISILSIFPKGEVDDEEDEEAIKPYDTGIWSFFPKGEVDDEEYEEAIKPYDLDFTGILESFFAEEENEKQILLPPQGMVFDTEAVEMTSNSSKQTKSEIEVIEDEASQRWPEGLQVEEMQQEAISTLKPQGVFDVEAVKMPESSGQMKFQIADKEMEPEADRPQEAQQFLMQVGLRLTEPPKVEDWENANEIYLMDNELSVLPENPRCPKLSALFLQRNYKLRLIPPSFFDNMPALQTLNLSGTNIKSLPNSIIRLVSLKRLFLNDCHCFMVLSPKIGELKQLEILSLEGTEIMDLPLDIKKLTTLTCLEVSFCEFQSNCRQAMQLNAVVPCGVISVLSQLEELSIDVDPGDERWDVCVEYIVNEVCTLKSLYSLKFYFQKVELLSHIQWNIPSLLYFRFTVGRHVKRIMSGVPRDVEFELERWDRCLKYINGVDVPRDIKKALQHATAFFLDRHATVKKLSNFGIQNMEKLKCLVMGECSEVQVIIDEADGYEEDDSDEIVSESYGTEKIVLGSLEYMYVYYMESLRSMWEGPGPLQPESLFCLKSLTLCTCPQLTTIFTPGLLANLCNLEELKVDDCPSIKSIVSHDITAEHKISYFLPELKKISLHYMPELVSISSGLHIAPKLEWLSFYDCPKLKNPLVVEISTQCLKGIKGEMSWWKALDWSDGRPAHLDEIFVLIDIGDC